MAAVARIRQVRVRNYKSIADVVVDLEPLTVFVGANGSGKSNFTDVLAFVRDCLTHSVEFAFKNRAGIQAVRRRSSGRPPHIAIGLWLDLEDGIQASYEFEIGDEPGGGFRVSREQCEVGRFLEPKSVFETKNGVFVRDVPGIRSQLSANRLALVSVSAVDEFAKVFDFLTSMRFYSIVPQRLRSFQEAGSEDSLAYDGSNAPAVLRRLQKEDPEVYERVCRILAQAVEGIISVSSRSVGSMETLQFLQDIGQSKPGRFDAQNMSDGTLRILGLLLAIYQSSYASMVGIEEPESTVHPAVAELLLEVLLDATHERQILVTTHSPDILDSKQLDADQIRVVRMKQGMTQIGRMSEADRETVRHHLYTPGELLRINELTPDPMDTERGWEQAGLFEPAGT